MNEGGKVRAGKIGHPEGINSGDGVPMFFVSGRIAEVGIDLAAGWVAGVCNRLTVDADRISDKEREISNAGRVEVRALRVQANVFFQKRVYEAPMPAHSGEAVGDESAIRGSQ